MHGHIVCKQVEEAGPTPSSPSIAWSSSPLDSRTGRCWLASVTLPFHTELP